MNLPIPNLKSTLRDLDPTHRNRLRNTGSTICRLYVGDQAEGALEISQSGSLVSKHAILGYGGGGGGDLILSGQFCLNGVLVSDSARLFVSGSIESPVSIGPTGRRTLGDDLGQMLSGDLTLDGASMLEMSLSVEDPNSSMREDLASRNRLPELIVFPVLPAPRRTDPLLFARERVT